MACHIPLESSQQGLRFCFRLHPNRRSTYKVMDVQSHGSPKTKRHLGVGPMARHKVHYKGEGGGFPQVLVVVNLVSLCLTMAHPCTKRHYISVLTNLLFGLCWSAWIIEPLVAHLSPISELQHTPLPPKCYKPSSMPQSFSFVVVLLDS